MIDIGKHISDLLYSHDCVIIPGFGGFIGNYSSAKLNGSRHLFSPPSKHIVFNKNLKNNDGLLANHLVFTQNISYSNALSEIEKYVGELNDKLKKGEKLQIGILGILFLDTEKNIQFNQGAANFLLDSFGLVEFHSPAIKQKKGIKHIEKITLTDTTKVVDLNAKQHFNFKRIAALAASFTLVAGLFWVSLKTDLVQNINYANLNPFSSKPNDTIVVIKNTIQQTDSSALAVAADSVEVTDSLLSATADKTTDTLAKTEEVVMQQPEKAMFAEHTVAATTDKQVKTKKYYIVTGCFQIEENAKNFVKNLLNENIESAIIGQNNSGLYIVSSGNYASYREAVNALNSIKETQPGAWLHKSYN